MRCTRTILFILIVVMAAPALAGSGKKKSKKKAMLETVGKLLKSGDSAGIAKYFRAKGKTELKLRRIKAGKYRDKQARSLLATYFKAIEPKSYTLKEVKDTYGKFAMEYRVKSTGKTIKGKTYVYVEKSDGKFRITGIVES